METNFFTQARLFLANRAVWAGLFLGVALTLISSLIRPLTLFRYANDPLQLVQPIIQLRFGLINFNWRLPLIHLGFVLAVSVFAPLVLRFFWPNGVSQENAVKAARIAALISMAYVWWLRVDAIPVVIWYGISTWISVALISWVTRQISKAFLPTGMRLNVQKY